MNSSVSEQIDIQSLLKENERLKQELSEATDIIDSIRDGGVDALIVNSGGKPSIYSLESADFTYRVLIEKFGEGALSISEEGVILYCNAYFSRLINIPVDKIIGTYFNSYVESVGKFKAMRDESLSGLSKGEIVLRVNDQLLPVYVSLTNLQPTIPAIGIIVTDLTERNEHEKELSENQRQLEVKIAELNSINDHLEQFIHIISHDIKEPIRKIVTYSTHLMATQANEIEPGKFKNLKIINNSALRLNSLVDDLVKFSLASSQKVHTEIDLNSLVEGVIDDLELIIAENDAKISFDQLPVITGSVVQMRQVFFNVLNNAIKYSKRREKSRIQISARLINLEENSAVKPYHLISITDNGIGMDEDHLKKIFTIFQRLHMPDQYSGNGIGLAICKKIIENHGGKIEAESVLGQGSTFNLYLPA